MILAVPRCVSGGVPFPAWLSGTKSVLSARLNAYADHAWSARDDARTTERPPSELLRRTFTDALVYTPAQLRHLVNVLGPGQVTLGSDYPFDMGVDDPVDRITAAGFDAATVAAICGGNAARLLGPLPGQDPAAEPGA